VAIFFINLNIVFTSKKINDFLEHFSEYCIQYYHRIIKQLFSYLKKAREESITKKYMVLTHSNKPKNKKIKLREGDNFKLVF